VRGPDALRYEPAYGPDVEVRAVELPGGARDATTIVGELLIPPGSRPRPAAVVLAGASAQDRYGFAGPPPVDLGTHAITDALVRAGFVVLRYDEPGTGGSAPREPSFALQVEDGRRALRLLSVQEEVDPDRLVIVGHGEGGWRALIVARELGPAVRGVALIGTPGRSFEAVYRERSAGVLAQVEPTLRERVAKQQAATLAALRDGGDVPEELRRQARWIREAFAIDPAALAASAGAPLWIGAGEADFEIDPVRDVDALAQAARKAGLRVTVARFAGLDHLLKPEPGRSTPERYRVPRDVDPAAIAALTAWCSAQAQAKGQAKGPSKPPTKPGAQPPAKPAAK
jgi:pimeloyl-ACP methyl ester carboxylesterase